MRSFFQYFNNNSVLSHHRIHRLLSIKLFRYFGMIRQYIIFICMCHALLRLIDAN